MKKAAIRRDSGLFVGGRQVAAPTIPHRPRIELVGRGLGRADKADGGRQAPALHRLRRFVRNTRAADCRPYDPAPTRSTSLRVGGGRGGKADEVGGSSTSRGGYQRGVESAIPTTSHQPRIEPVGAGLCPRPQMGRCGHRPLRRSYEAVQKNGRTQFAPTTSHQPRIGLVGRGLGRADKADGGRQAPALHCLRRFVRNTRDDVLVVLPFLRSADTFPSRGRLISHRRWIGFVGGGVTVQ